MTHVSANIAETDLLLQVMDLDKGIFLIKFVNDDNHQGTQEIICGKSL